MVASLHLQILLRLRPYPMTGHGLLCYARAVHLNMHASRLVSVTGLYLQV